MDNTTSASASRQLSSTTITNIAILSIVGVTSALLLLFGDFEGKGTRVVSTLISFGLFTVFSTLENSIKRPALYKIGNVSNLYLLGLSLLLIWGSMFTRMDSYFYDGVGIVLGVVLLALVIKGGSLIMMKLATHLSSDYPQVVTASRITSFLFGASAVLLSLPIGLNYMLQFTEFYWRLTVACIILAGLAMSIQALVVHSFKDKDPERNGNATSNQSPQGAPVASFATGTRQTPTEGAKVPENAKGRPMVAYPASAEESPQVATGTLTGPPAFSAPTNANAAPWPLFPNGLPLPAKPNGRPDYQALQYMASVFIESERQWFKN